MPSRHILALCYAASGAAALVYQVAWVRLFTLTLGHTVAASSTVLAAFMGGFAIGALVWGRRADRVQRPALHGERQAAGRRLHARAHRRQGILHAPHRP